MIESETILDTDKLYRRFREDDFKEGQLKSSAFSDTTEKQPSVHLERLANFNSINELYRDKIVSYGVLLMSVLRKNEFDAEHKPLDSDISHSVILTLTKEGFTRGARKKLKKLVSQIIDVDT